MSADLDGRILAGEWIHAHEEDRGGEMIFRRADADLPPSRGRTMLSVSEDLSAVRHGPGADDRPVTKGTCRLVPAGTAAADEASFEVMSYTTDRLVIGKR